MVGDGVEPFLARTPITEEQIGAKKGGEEGRCRGVGGKGRSRVLLALTTAVVIAFVSPDTES